MMNDEVDTSPRSTLLTQYSTLNHPKSAKAAS